MYVGTRLCFRVENILLIIKLKAVVRDDQNILQT